MADKSKKELHSGPTEVQPQVKKGPIKTIRQDDCAISIWGREVQVRGEPKTFYSCSIERSYKDSSGDYRYSRYFGLEDLGKVVALCKQADEFIRGLIAEEPGR